MDPQPTKICKSVYVGMPLVMNISETVKNCSRLWRQNIFLVF